MKVFIKKAAQYGAKVVSDKGKHLKFRDSLGHQISAPKTTSDWRAIKNFESELRGRGFINQQATKNVKDALVKGTKETALPASRKTPPAGRSASAANQQTTFKQFTQRFQPNVQGPNKPNSPVKRGRVQGPETELENRMKKAYDKRVDAVLSLPDKKKSAVPAKMPKKLTDYEMYQLRNLNLTAKQKRKFRELGLLEQMVVPRGLKKKNPLMTPETEMELLKRLSNRKSFYDRARTGRPIYPFSEDNKHRDAKLNYQYKQVTNPKPVIKPLDVVKQKKGLV